MDLVNRLKLFLERRQIAISQFADTCRIPRPTVSQILNGRNKKISDELITKIHDAYPDLSVLWLMFGEGEMTVEANTRISEAQNGAISPSHAAQPAMGQHNAMPEFNFEAPADSSPEKFPDLFSSTTDALQPETGKKSIEFERKPSDAPANGNSKSGGLHISAPQNGGGASITLNPDAFKKITNIVVFYSDNSFESFSPSPA